MQTLKINIPEGFVIDSFNQNTGEVNFKAKPKKVTEHIRTVADVLQDNGITPQQFDQSCKELTADEKAYRILKLLAKSLNEGWQPDWNNSQQSKFAPWFYMGGSSGFRYSDYVYWASHSDIGSRLCFKTRELAEYAGTQFKDVYEQFMTIQS